jgi:hypothetical protein
LIKNKRKHLTVNIPFGKTIAQENLTNNIKKKPNQNKNRGKDNQNAQICSIKFRSLEKMFKLLTNCQKQQENHQN